MVRKRIKILKQRLNYQLKVQSLKSRHLKILITHKTRTKKRKAVMVNQLNKATLVHRKTRIRIRRVEREKI